MLVHTIDLKFLGEPAAIAAFVIPDAAGYTMVECGPFSTHETLLAQLAVLEIAPSEIHTLLLTHIHFDHAGAAWWWAARGTRVYVHPRGLKHMIDPTRLYGSAARIYGEDNMAKLWGKMEKIDAASITAVGDREALALGGHTWTAHHTPGHASHHIAWQVRKVVFTGDVGGVKIKGGPVVPPCPPPDINAEDWNASLDRLASLSVNKFYLTHYGEVPVADHLPALRKRLTSYVEWVANRLLTIDDPAELVPGFTEMVEAELRQNGVPEKVISAYRVANPPYMSVAGIARYLSTKK
ncbi:MBL fold metallo-hydrolase [Neolewinella antarctica]|uniref:Glyoxylase-like metal-dependent hydrolase (Beta-lactamase superfamily II) n=1 Tax=Neolewinella antarctica TaxID=442734 RepID=A0ABX0X7N1_9BACT|nr:MBL fold metallo-hydrolase [Neolewinella antarctica]NJC24873.1 glyoxylase-like metal-dependent hydrolase (beta-lactamase superfamily II) [Neolewinella antarctica]